MFDTQWTCVRDHAHDTTAQPTPADIENRAVHQAIEGIHMSAGLFTAWARALARCMLCAGLMVSFTASPATALAVRGGGEQRHHHTHRATQMHQAQRIKPHAAASTWYLGSSSSIAMMPRLFSPASVWNEPLSSTAPLDRASAAMSAVLAAEAAREYQSGIGPWIQTSSDSTPIYIVGAKQPTVTVRLDNPTLWWRVSLQQAFAAVPIPPGAQPARGPDAQMTVWQPSTNELWEFFQMRLESDGWHAAWGGAMDNVSQSPGYYTSDSWPGALSVWGATATSLPVAAGVITLNDLRRGYINHAIAIDLPATAAGEWSWPAERSDGSATAPNSIPEGAELRLDPKLNLAALQLPPLVGMIAQAAQKYGMIVRDQTGWAIGIFIQDPTPTGSDPFYTDGVPSQSGPFQGKWPDQLMSHFPWRSLEVLQMSLQH